MTLPLATVILIPMLGAAALAAMPGYRVAAMTNVALNFASFIAALFLAFGVRESGDYFILDDVNALFVLLNTLVGFTASLFSAGYIAHELAIHRLTPGLVRFYHAMFLAMMGAMNLALLANNIGLMWVGLELATLMAVIMTGLYRTPAAVEAAWKYFILGSVAVSLAFFGTILIYLAGQAALGEGLPAMTWSRLVASARGLDPAMVNLAFVFLLVGYGAKVGLAPLHAWLPDAHSEGPTPVSAVLSGLLLNIALFVLLRFKMIVAATPGAVNPGPVMIAAGLATLIFAAFMLYTRRDIKRFFAYSSLEHMGLIVFAFGVGGPLANFAGLLHMAMHSLTKSSIFFAVGHITQAKGTQTMAEIRGLSESHPGLALCLAAGVLAIAGLPPSGVFMSEFLIITTSFAQNPWLAFAAAFGLFVAFGAVLWRLQEMIFGDPSPTKHDIGAYASLAPMVVHLSLIAGAGLALPGQIVWWFTRAAELLK